MSFKLQDRIQRIKGLPKKYKSLLLAMASHARNDGTNVIAAKKTLADEMGVVRFTVNRNMDALLVTGLVMEAETHVCRNEFCSKGPRHYIERGNHWTQAYNIDLVALQNVTPLPKKVASQNVQESRHILCESGVTICAAKQGLENPAALGSDEASVLTDGKEVSKSVSESAAAPASPSPSSPTKTQNPSGYEALDERSIAVLESLYPRFNPPFADIEKYIPELEGVAQAFTVSGWNDFFAWHRTHKPPKLHYRTVAKFLEGVYYSLNDYTLHDPSTCTVCKALGAAERIGTCTQCGTGGGSSDRDGMCQPCWDAANAADAAVIRGAKQARDIAYDQMRNPGSYAKAGVFGEEAAE